MRYIFGFVLIMSHRLDGGRLGVKWNPEEEEEEDACYTSSQSWKLESLAAPRGGGYQGGERETKQMQVR